LCGPWIEQGFGPKRIQTLMGHASVAMTFDRYGYLFEAREADEPWRQSQQG
jgi:integrase